MPSSKITCDPPTDAPAPVLRENRSECGFIGVRGPANETNRLITYL